VVTTGPYGIVRHPGYVGVMLVAASTPLIIGSFYGLVPAGIIVILLLIRTVLEDKTLQEELDGYSDYANKVEYKLIPLVW
jgi:protein-S-isoprenylcysteine O-methyltransferase Ste14